MSHALNAFGPIYVTESGMSTSIIFLQFSKAAFPILTNDFGNFNDSYEYDFSDVDKLLELAEKNGRKVMMKFLLECAPLYI